MARKSRKEQQLQALLPQKAEPETVTEEISPVKWKVATYARLSVPNPFYPEQDSIEKQLTAAKEYISKHPDMEAAGTYCDKGYSGADFSRPGFMQLLDDMEKGQFNCLIIKDFSRLGRHYLNMDQFLYHVFPDHGVRVISLLDGYDSLDGDSNVIAHAMKNILNDYFRKDLGRKVTSVLMEKRSQGLYAQITPYGYCHRPEQKGLLLIDVERAPVIYMIFAWAERGVNDTDIARYLTDLQISRPLTRFMNDDCSESFDETYWYNSSICYIVDNVAYAGDYTFKIPGTDTPEASSLPRSERPDYAYLPDNHIPYIKRCDFAPLQAKRQAMHDKYYFELQNGLKTIERKYPFSRLVYCGECHHRMNLLKGTDAPDALTCKGHFRREPIWHQPFSITVASLTDQVLDVLRKEQTETASMMREFEQAGEAQMFRFMENHYLKETDRLSALTNACTARKERADRDLGNGILDREIWQMQIDALTKELSSLHKESTFLQQKLLDIKNCEEFCPQVFREFANADFSEQLSSATLHRLVERIEIYNDQHIRVILRNGMHLQKLKDFLTEWQSLQEDEVKTK